MNIKKIIKESSMKAFQAGLNKNEFKIKTYDWESVAGFADHLLVMRQLVSLRFNGECLQIKYKPNL
jgi:hypothetical protein